MTKIRSIKQLGLGLVLALFALLISFLISKWIHAPLKKNGVKIYYADNISQAHKNLIDKFNKLHQGNIEVISVNLPFSKFSTNERKELLARSLRSQSDRLDVFAVDVIWVPRFAKWSEPLGPFFPVLEEKRLIPNILDTAIYDSVLMAMPLYTDLMHVYYRRDLIEKITGHEDFIEKLKAGITWSQLIDFAQKHEKKYPEFFVFPGKNFEGLMCMFYANLYSQGVVFQSESKPIKKNAEAIKAIEILSDLVHRYKISPEKVAYMDEYEGYIYAIENDVPMFVGWPGLIEQQSKILRENNMLDKISMAPLPRFSNGKTVSIYGGWNLMISKNSKNKAAAAEFIKFATSESNQKRMNNEGGFIPVRQNIFSDAESLSLNTNLLFYKNLVSTGMCRPLHVDYTQVSDIYSYFFNRVIKGEISADRAFEKAEQELKALQITVDMEQ